ncbi:E3 ubiquitin-protein ligase RNF167-like [Pelodiscus sinensis]|uniref:E3 ubiquitin-protein ligase RNF167-like n=1 Tax=Pelodiscus sinensis TaxID=13735 RepID=UPI003F6B603A
MWPVLLTPFRLITVLLLFKAPTAEVFVYVVYKQNSTCIDFRALSACLGPPVPREGLRGYLIEAVPANACQPIRGPPAGSNASATFIVLISRYDCPLGVKILHAQQAGYQAAIVHNVNSEKLVTMVTNVEEIRQKVGIPSVFTGQSASQLLRKAMGSEKHIHVTLVVPEHYQNPCWADAKFSLGDAARHYWALQFGYCSKHVISLFIREFGMAIGMIVCTLLVVGCIRWCKKRQKITTSTFKTGDKYVTCVICMAEYEEGDQLKILPCSHVYHVACIDSWLLVQSQCKTCPICKQQVTIAK